MMVGHEGEDAYRERMEAFVSDLTGTTMLELVVVSIPIPMGLWLLAEAKVMCIGYNIYGCIYVLEYGYDT